MCYASVCESIGHRDTFYFFFPHFIPVFLIKRGFWRSQNSREMSSFAIINNSAVRVSTITSFEFQSNIRDGFSTIIRDKYSRIRLKSRNIILADNYAFVDRLFLMQMSVSEYQDASLASKSLYILSTHHV